MNMSLDIAWKSLNKKKEELCGDTVGLFNLQCTADLSKRPGRAA